jgi:molybdopterin converting factor small subunit
VRSVGVKPKDVGDGGVITRILFFGRLREAAGRCEMTAAIPAYIRDQGDLAAFLAGDDDGLRAELSARAVRLAVDGEILAEAAQFRNAREIAFLPPFSGG